jgi:hypothetical protein
MRPLDQPWTPQDDELEGVRGSGASVVRAAAALRRTKALSANAPRSSAAHFHPCASRGKNGPIRQIMNGEEIE